MADTRQMEYDFGVSAAQARTRSMLLAAGGSGLEADEAVTHAPTGGLQSLQLNANVAYMIDFRWTAIAFLSGSRLVGDAAESPLVRARHAIMAVAGISYRW